MSDDTKIKRIELSKGKVAVVDEDDFEYLSRYKWHLHKDGYAVRNIRTGVSKRSLIMMHREIMRTPKGMEVDHINGNKLDNRRENLRNCTHKENMANQKKREQSTSNYKGVTWNKQSNKWCSQVRSEGRTLYFGIFDSEKDAAHAYNLWARNKFGEFAKLNDLGNYKPNQACKRRYVKRSEHRYISWNNQSDSWRVKINGKYIGSSKDLDKAIEIRNKELMNSGGVYHSSPNFQ